MTQEGKAEKRKEVYGHTHTHTRTLACQVEGVPSAADAEGARQVRVYQCLVWLWQFNQLQTKPNKAAIDCVFSGRFSEGS